MNLTLDHPATCILEAEFRTQAQATDLKFVGIVLRSDGYFLFADAFAPVVTVHAGDTDAAVPGTTQIPETSGAKLSSPENMTGALAFITAIFGSLEETVNVRIECDRSPQSASWRASTQVFGATKHTTPGQPRIGVWNGFVEAGATRQATMNGAFQTEVVELLAYEIGGEGSIDLRGPQGSRHWAWVSGTKENEFIHQWLPAGNYDVTIERTQITTRGPVPAGESGGMTVILAGLGQETQLVAPMEA